MSDSIKDEISLEQQSDPNVYVSVVSENPDCTVVGALSSFKIGKKKIRIEMLTRLQDSLQSTTKLEENYLFVHFEQAGVVTKISLKDYELSSVDVKTSQEPTLCNCHFSFKKILTG